MIFATASSSTLPYFAAKRLLEQDDDHVGVLVGGAEDERLLVLLGIDVLDELAEHGAVEVLGDDAPVEGVDLERHLVGQLLLLHALGRAVEDEHLFARLVADAVLRELRDDADRAARGRRGSRR